MDRGNVHGALSALRTALGRYKYAVAAVLLGTVLMLLPAGGRARVEADAPERESTVREEMEATLSAFEGVGRLRVMLTAEAQTGRWTGAVVVCEGGGSAAVRLELTRAVSALTGLSTDKIAIVKGTP